MSLYKLYFSSGATVIALPINPEKLPETLSADNGTYNVLGLGPIMQPRTPNLRTVSISGLLPGRRLPGQTGIHLPPAVYMAFFTTAMKKKSPSSTRPSGSMRTVFRSWGRALAFGASLPASRQRSAALRREISILT